MEVIHQFQVENRHINAGIPRDFKLCPIARAMKDAGYDNPSVGARLLSYDSADSQPQRVTLFCDADLYYWILSFDKGERVDPCTIALMDNEENNIFKMVHEPETKCITT